jgi:hypothetical protein
LEAIARARHDSTHQYAKWHDYSDEWHHEDEVHMLAAYRADPLMRELYPERFPMTAIPLSDQIAAVRREFERAEDRLCEASGDIPKAACDYVLALRAALETLEASEWRPITDEQRDGETYLLNRCEPNLDPFVGYWDAGQGAWFSLAGAYAMEPEPLYFIPLSALPRWPSHQKDDG